MPEGLFRAWAPAACPPPEKRERKKKAKMSERKEKKKRNRQKCGMQLALPFDSSSVCFYLKSRFCIVELNGIKPDFMAE